MKAFVASVILSLFLHISYVIGQKSSDVLSFNETSNTCVPEKLCGGINLDQIPNFSDHIPTSVFYPTKDHAAPLRRLYDQKKIRSCFKNKKICMLGDSTMEETIHDLVTLLSGLSANKSIENVLAYFGNISNARDPMRLTNPLFGDVDQKLIAGGPRKDRAHRIMDIQVHGINASIFHYFTGAVDVTKNDEGISALLYRVEDLFYSHLYDCDVLMINSAAHDFQRYELYDPSKSCFQALSPGSGLPEHCLDEFMPILKKIHQKLTDLYTGKSTYPNVTDEDLQKATKKNAAERASSRRDTMVPPAPWFESIALQTTRRKKLAGDYKVTPNSNVKILWRGDPYSAGIDAFIPNIVKRELQRQVKEYFLPNTTLPLLPVHFIDTDYALSRLPPMHHHINHHIGQLSHYWNSPIPLLWSSLSTQVIVDNICYCLEDPTYINNAKTVPPEFLLPNTPSSH